MLTNLLVNDFPSVYAALVEAFPHKPWLRRTETLDQHARSTPLQHALARKNNGIAYSLSLFDQHGLGLMDTPDEPEIIVALCLMAQALALTKASDGRARSRLLKRLEGAFRNPDDMRALQMELHTATHLHRLGSRVEWSDECSGQETYDMLIISSSGQEVEVECKTWSEDKGVAITAEQAAGLLQHLDGIKTKLIEIVKPGEVLAVTFTVAAGLPRGEPEQRRLALDLVEAIVESQTEKVDAGQISFLKLPAPLIRQLEADDRITYCSQLVDAAAGPAVGYRAVIGDRQRAIVVELRSERVSKKFSRMLKDAKHAIRDQMTGTRPGCLVVRLEGISGPELLERITEAGSVPTVFAHALFQDEQHEHLDCIVWMSDPALQELAPGIGSSQSVSYVMRRSQGRYSNLNLGIIFNPH
ncbi:hypothetical protein ACSMFQ_11360 [Ectopseudomonas chengduensis]|nr:hypothetical protein [Pseudomonas chengduensis]MDH1561438.1 hypothetical protein [Pseudomonas chengduensis]